MKPWFKVGLLLIGIPILGFTGLFASWAYANWSAEPRPRLLLGSANRV